MGVQQAKGSVAGAGRVSAAAVEGVGGAGFVLEIRESYVNHGMGWDGMVRVEEWAGIKRN